MTERPTRGRVAGTKVEQFDVAVGSADEDHVAIGRLVAELGTVEGSKGTARYFIFESALFNVEKHEITIGSGSHQFVVPCWFWDCLLAG